MLHTVDSVGRELRYAVRALRATPTFTIVALAVLTLSIGAAAAIFSVVDAVVLRALPFVESDRLVAVGEWNVNEDPTTSRNLVAPQNFVDWRARQDVFSGLAAVWDAGISVDSPDAGTSESLRAQAVTAEFFTVLRAIPLIGRTFTADDEIDGNDQVAVISYGFWQRRFGGAADIVGRTVSGPLASWQIIGVMPPGFAYPVDDVEPTEMWVPYVIPEEQRVRGDSFGYVLQVIGRLRDGVSIEQARTRMEQINAALAAETPRWFTDRVVRVAPLRDEVIRPVRSLMLMLLGAVSFVLLIACVNLANLMLVRATTRSRELAVRAALGASRWHLSRGLLTESLVLSSAGAALGVVAAWWGLEILRAWIPAGMPRAAGIALDLRVLGASVVAALVTGLAFGSAPALQFGTRAPASPLAAPSRSGTAGRGAQRVRAGLVAVQVALAVILLVGSGLFLASFARVTRIDLGFDRHDVFTARVRLLELPTDPELAARRNRDLLLNVLDRVRAIPGVGVASLLNLGLPLRGDLQTVDLGIPGRTLPANTDIMLSRITEDYFEAIGVPIVAGRTFTPFDRDDSPAVVILNELAADRYFGDEDPIGKVVLVQGTRTVVGVVGNVRHEGPEGDWRTQAYVPLRQGPAFGATLVLRTVAGSAGIPAAVREAIAAEFPSAQLPTLVELGTLEARFDALVVQRRFTMLLLSLFGSLGVVIATIGIYGVTAYSVLQRRREISIRLAIGALPATIVVSVLGHTSRYLVAGMVIGLAGAWSLAALVEGFLFQVEPHEPVVYIAVCSALLATGLAACFLPARRAARVDPLSVLRGE